MLESLEFIILAEMQHNAEFVRASIPYIKPEYFEQDTSKLIFKTFLELFDKYNAVPSKAALSIGISSSTGTSDATVRDSLAIVAKLHSEYIKQDPKWVLFETEKWCKDRSVMLAIITAIDIIDGNHATLRKEGLPKLLSDALSVCFDSDVGHDFFNNAEERYDYYHSVEEKIPFDIKMLNDVTLDGLPRQTLNILMAGTGVGKTLVMCHLAASYLKAGYNVLYITLEMAEKRIAERIDANTMQVPLKELKYIEHDTFIKKVGKIQEKTKGRLIIKQYPTGAAHVGHFRALLDELRTKQDYKPDIIFIDYIGICASSRFKAGSGANSYTVVKAVAEEVRGLAVESDTVIVSAVQTNRGGFSNTDAEMTDISESFGITHTADFFAVLIRTEELDADNQILIKILKNRYNDLAENKRFVVGVDRSQMRLYDVENSTDFSAGSSKPVDDDVPLFDKGKFGSRQKSNNDFKF